ncbi:MAG: glycosyltransferase family 2 protein [Sphingobacteriaceae bacterium]|nr:glycosyltransferase family 2 protein [Sphingobacteriaceae bacterium]
MNFNPKVSVIIPVFNRENLIQKSINSVLNQTYKNLELIVVDDASTDNTAQKISEIKDKD